MIDSTASPLWRPVAGVKAKLFFIKMTVSAALSIISQTFYVGVVGFNMLLNMLVTYTQYDFKEIVFFVWQSSPVRLLNNCVWYIF